MKEILKQYVVYNKWANQRLCELILTLNEEQLQQNIVSSFPGIRKTLLHMWDAESIWWQRMKLSEQIIRPSTASEYTINEVTKGIFRQDRQWEEWVSEATEAALNHVLLTRIRRENNLSNPYFKCCCMFLIIVLIIVGSWLQCYDSWELKIFRQRILLFGAGGKSG